MLGRKQLGVDESESLDDMLRASQSMVRLVMNLLDVSRSEDGALIPHVTEFDLPTLLSRGVQGDGAAGRGQGPAAGAGVARRRSGRCAADRDLIRRVLENLIDNAYKYGPRHTTISIEILPATMDDGAEPAVEIRVRDEGEGVPASYRQLIFEKYGRVEGRRARTRARQPRPRVGVLPARGRRARRGDLGRGRRRARAAASACGCRSRGCRSRGATPAVGRPRGGLAV